MITLFWINSSYSSSGKNQTLAKGCPESSVCSVEFGKKYQKMLEALEKDPIQKILTEFGLPLKYYAWEKDKLDSNNTILWQSFCFNSPQKRKLYIALSFFKKLPPKLFVRKAWSLKKNFYLFGKSGPLFIEKGFLYSFYNLNEKEYLLGNNTKLIKVKSALKFDFPLPEKSSCGPSLLRRFKAWPQMQTLPYCQKVWDFDQKKYVSLVIQRSCSQ